MATITEDYVSFEIAKLLKEKGFPQNPNICNTAYTPRGKLSNNAKSFTYNFTEFDKLRIKPRTYSMAPTLQMAMKWLREVHNCPIEILWHWNTDSQCSEWYFMHHMELKPLPQIQYYDTYEQACEAAIKYCLERLI